MSAAQLFSEGVELATMAVGHDNAGNYTAARPLYFQAAEILHRLSNAEPNPDRKQSFRDKATHYVARVEELNAVLGIEAVPVVTSPRRKEDERWVRQEAFGDRAYKDARTLHEERDVRQAVQEYKKAMEHYVDASREADVASQHRIREKWNTACSAAEKISGVLGTVFNKGPNTIIDTSPRHAVEAPPDAPTSLPSHSSGDGNGGNDGPDDDDDSFSALQARLARLKK